MLKVTRKALGCQKLYQYIANIANINLSLNSFSLARIVNVYNVAVPALELKFRTGE